MTLAHWVQAAAAAGASDLHIAGDGQVHYRIDGDLVPQPTRIIQSDITGLLDELLSSEQRAIFTDRRSLDLGCDAGGVRCRLNVFYAQGAVNLAVRILPGRLPTLTSLRLHPDLAHLCLVRNGLVLVSGPTGSGKSSTLAALLNQINHAQARHIITVENPIEFPAVSEKSLIQQREVGRDTPSFEQGILDALRQDPDVLIVGEMREPETMRLVLGAAETGHLVMSTVHSSNCAEALQRIVAAFPSEIQSAVAAELADAVVAVVAQRLQWDTRINARVPICEILRTNPAVRNHIRNQDFFKIGPVLETGAEEGMFTFDRYARWVSGEGITRNAGPADQAARLTEQAPPARAGRIEIDSFAGSLSGILRKDGPKGRT